MNNVLIFGGNGFLGQKFKERLPNAETPNTDITDTIAVAKTLDSLKPDLVLNCAGKTGRPNVDWCEDHKEETYRSNVTGPVILGEECRKRSIHLTHLGSGCIYTGTNYGKGYREEDVPNFFGSVYSRSKIECETQLGELDSRILQLRLRMPFDKVPGARNFVTKLVGYQRIINEQNSVSVIDDFLDASLQLMEKQATGIYNMTNPGAITHSEILDMYREIVDPEFTYVTIPTSELNTKAGRSNCVLNTAKLVGEGIVMPDIHDAVRKALKHYKAHHTITSS